MTGRATGVREQSPAVVVMAKEPALQGVKTRLVDLDPEARLELYRAFLADKIDQVCALTGAIPFVAYTPGGAEGTFSEMVGGRAGLIAQRGVDLGERLCRVAGDLLARGHQGVLIVDSDTPNLPPELLAEGLAALAAADVVLGPAWDGGYYLIGVREPRVEPFSGIPWSTPRVLSRTVAAARAAGLSLHLLPSWYDVDTPADLDRLASDLAATPPARPGFPHRTARAVASLRPAPPRTPRQELWRTLSSRPVYRNQWIRVEENVVDMGGGRLTLYGVVECSGCVGVVPLLPDGRVVMVRQFRYVARRHTWEIPTGGVHAGESLEAAAQRELVEETGFRAGRLRHLQSFHTSKSVVDEVAHLYVGEDLTEALAPADDTEDIEVRPFPFETVLQMVRSGEIVDGMTVVASLALAGGRGPDWRP